MVDAVGGGKDAVDGAAWTAGGGDGASAVVWWVTGRGLTICRAVVGAGVAAGAVSVGGGAAVTGAVGVGVAAFDAVPGRLKFCSSRGPTVLGAGELAVAGSVAFCASADAGSSHSPPASKIQFQRKIALIAPALRDSPRSSAQRR